jgi:hypothetical protein
MDAALGAIVITAAGMIAAAVIGAFLMFVVVTGMTFLDIAATPAVVASTVGETSAATVPLGAPTGAAVVVICCVSRAEIHAVRSRLLYRNRKRYKTDHGR